MLPNHKNYAHRSPLGRCFPATRHACTHAHTRTHARTHARPTHTHTHTLITCQGFLANRHARATYQMPQASWPYDHEQGVSQPQGTDSDTYTHITCKRTLATRQAHAQITSVVFPTHKTHTHTHITGQIVITRKACTSTDHEHTHNHTQSHVSLLPDISPPPSAQTITSTDHKPDVSLQ